MIQQKTRKDRNSVCYKVRFLKPVLSEPSSCKSRKNLRHCHQLCSVLPSRVNPLPNELKKDLKHLWSCQSYLRYQSVIVFVHRLLSGSYFFSFGHTSDACYSAPRCGGLFCIAITDFEFDDGNWKRISIDFQFRIKMVTPPNEYSERWHHYTYMSSSIVVIIEFLCCFIE